MRKKQNLLYVVASANRNFRAPHYNPMEPWDGYREKSFREFVYSGEASKFIREMYQDDFVNSFQWTPAQDEALSHSVSQDSYRNEIATYRRLEWMQGQNIPKLLATFKFEMSDFRPTTYSEFFVVQGFMIEYIPGFLLSDLLEHVDCAKWQTIVDEVVSAIEAAGDFGVLNEDLDHRHFIVRKEQRPGTKEDEDARFVPVMFDFGQTHLCEEYGSLEEWLEAKCLQGEEDYVAVSMRDMVRKSGGTLQVTRRHRWGWHNEVGWHCPQGLFPWRQSPAVPVREVHMEKRSPLDFMYCLEIVG